jgi:hypothetical protein
VAGNFLNKAIPPNYDPAGSYGITVTINDLSSNSLSVGIGNSQFPWTLNTNSGILLFTGNNVATNATMDASNALPNILWTVSITFWAYTGATGFPASSSTYWSVVPNSNKIYPSSNGVSYVIGNDGDSAAYDILQIYLTNSTPDNPFSYWFFNNGGTLGAYIVNGGFPWSIDGSGNFNGQLYIGGSFGIPIASVNTIFATLNGNSIEITGGSFFTTNVTTAFATTNGTVTDITGGAFTGASYNATSDYRVKEDIFPLLLEDYSIDNLNPITFKYKTDKKQSIGLIAHELQEDFPFLVEGEKDGEKTQTVNYIGLIGVLIKEIQELKKRVKTLEEKK